MPSRTPSSTSSPRGRMPDAVDGSRARPANLRVLYVTAEAHAADELRELLATERYTSVELEATDRAGCAARLREQSFDGVLVRHAPPALDALQLVEALRAAGGEMPVLILGEAAEASAAPRCDQAGADAYVAWPTSAPHLLWTLRRVTEWRRLLAENRRLSQTHQQRLRLEHNEAERLLGQQRALLSELEDLSTGGLAESASLNARRATPLALEGVPRDLASEWLTDYEALLRAYVIMGSGNLADDIVSLVGRFATAGLSARDVMRLHVHAVEGLLASLGKRGARHAMTRGDLLILEVMMHLAETYRG